MSEPMSAPPRMGVDELRRHVEAGDVFLIDVRTHTGREQIYGAIRYDTHKLREAKKLVLPLPKEDGLIVLYDEHGDGTALKEIAAKLQAQGYGVLRSLEGGFAAWKAADGKLEGETVEQPVPLVSEQQLER